MKPNQIKTNHPSRIPGLDGIRAFAIILVLCAHFIPKSTHNSFLHLLAQKGGYGVEIFFILSGFLITHLLIKEEDKLGTFSLKAFYLRRTLRILPPLLTYLAILWVLDLLSIRNTPGTDFFSCLAFLRNYFGSSQITEHIWTLSIEEQFYILLPILLYYFKPAKIRIFILAVSILLLSPWRQFCYLIEDTNFRRTDLRVEPLLTGSLLAVLQSSKWGTLLKNPNMSKVSLICALFFDHCFRYDTITK